MDKKPQSQIRRRDFLKGSTMAAVVGVSCLSLDLRAALAQARATGKPLFTENNVNRLIRANPWKSRSGQLLAHEAEQDVKSFIRNHFYLTAEQEQELASVSAEEASRVQNKITEICMQGGKLDVRIQRETKRALNAEESNAFVKSGFLEPARAISIDIGCTTDGGLSCHFTITKKS